MFHTWTNVRRTFKGLIDDFGCIKKLYSSRKCRHFLKWKWGWELMPGSGSLHDYRFRKPGQLYGGWIAHRIVSQCTHW